MKFTKQNQLLTCYKNLNAAQGMRNRHYGQQAELQEQTSTEKNIWTTVLLWLGSKLPQSTGNIGCNWLQVSSVCSAELWLHQTEHSPVLNAACTVAYSLHRGPQPAPWPTACTVAPSLHRVKDQPNKLLVRDGYSALLLRVLLSEGVRQLAELDVHQYEPIEPQGRAGSGGWTRKGPRGRVLTVLLHHQLDGCRGEVETLLCQHCKTQLLLSF